ncbi:MAG: hypothetical protein D6730_05585 [Bacteroidetes bacterium]|nr:MAG: hypothetical protein D6730_05585 [Bacteroidota bacterium]
MTLLFIFLNYRGRRSWYAAMLVVLGAALVWVGKMNGGWLEHAYGAVLVLVGVWVNGSFYYVYRSCMGYFQRKQILNS